VFVPRRDMSSRVQTPAAQNGGRKRNWKKSWWIWYYSSVETKKVREPHGQMYIHQPARAVYTLVIVSVGQKKRRSQETDRADSIYTCVSISRYIYVTPSGIRGVAALPSSTRRGNCVGVSNNTTLIVSQIDVDLMAICPCTLKTFLFFQKNKCFTMFVIYMYIYR
jgi:hypothetical protein